MKTVMTVIVDNTPAAGMCGEWGLSILVEHRDQTILVDAGASDLFAENMSKLGFDIKDVDFGVLSHAHYDHANGLPTFFEQNSKAKFYLRDQTAADCYGKKFIFRKYIGIPKRLIDDYADRISLVSGDYELYEGAYLVPHKKDGLAEIGKREKMYRRTSGGWRPDDFSHEQSLVLDTERGLVRKAESCSNDRELEELLGLPENEEVLMVMDLGYAAEGAGPLPNHTSRKDLAETVSYL